MTFTLANIPFDDESVPAGTQNLLFGATGDTSADIAADAAETFGLLVSANPDDLAEGHVTDSGRRLEPVLVRPGEFHPARIRRALAALICGDWDDLPLEVLMVSRFGFPPLPDPAEPFADEVFAAGHALAGHPVFWLPRDIVHLDHPADLNDDVRMIRYWLELSARGMADFTTGNFIDVFEARGLDATEGPLADVLAVRADGGWAPELDQFVVATPPDLPDGDVGRLWALAEAAAYVSEFTRTSHTAEIDGINSQALEVIDTFDSTTVAHVMALAFEPAARQWFDTPGDPQVAQDLRDATYKTLAFAYRTGLELADLMSLACDRKAGTLLGSNPTIDENSTAMAAYLAENYEICVYATDIHFEQLFVVVSPDARGAALTELWNIVATHLTSLFSWGREVSESWQNDGPIDVSEVDPATGIPPTVSLPSVPPDLRIFTHPADGISPS